MRRFSPMLLAVFCAPAGQAADVDVKILDWNTLTYNDPGSDEYNALVRIVEAIDPDIILFEEANNAGGRSAFMTRFASRYPYSFLGAPTYENPRNQILSAYPLSNTEQIFTDDPNSQDPFERPTIRADVDVLPLQPGTELRVYAAHYKAGSETRDETLRLNQATDDADDIEALVTGDPEARVYYAGDLNAEVGDPPLNELLEPRTTLSRLTIVNPNNGNDETRWPSGRTIDHIFYSATLAGRVHDGYIFYSNTYPPGSVPPPALPGDSETASDHLALVATVTIPEDLIPDEDVLINEVHVRHNTAQWETNEFIELVGPPGFSLAGLSIVVIEGDAPNPGLVDRVWSFNGSHEIPANGFFVAGDAGVNPDFQTGAFNTMENGTQTILLVRNVTVTIGQDVDLDNDGNPEVTEIGTIEDGVGLADGGLGSGDQVYYDAPIIGPDGVNVPPGAARVPDAADTDTTDDWAQLSYFLDGSDGEKAPSPGLANLPGDFDRDGDVDQDDFGVFQAGMAGPNNPTLDARTDLDDDSDTDQADFGIFQAHLTGAQ